MDVKPWEPVSGWCIPDGQNPLLYQEGMSWPFSRNDYGTWHTAPMRVTLANGQRIIVRALSEDRKAARAAKRDSRGMTDMERFKWKGGK